jgi:hypothetical protein
MPFMAARLLLALTLAAPSVSNVAFANDDWSLDQRRCIGYVINGFGQQVRLEQMNGVLMMDAIGSDHRPSFSENEQISIAVDGKILTRLYYAKRTATGWYILGVADPIFEEFRRGHSLRLSSENGGLVVAVDLKGIDNVASFLRKCQLRD